MGGKLPKSLWRFYIQYGFRGYWWLAVIWGALSMVTVSDRVLQPLMQGWIIGLFENGAPEWFSSNFLVYALPTIILVTVINVTMSLAHVARMWAMGSLVPRANRRISETLTTYVHSQSMSFWNGRMAGQIKNQMTYVSDGFNTIPDIVANVLRALTIFVNGALLLQINRYVAYMFIGVIVLRVLFAWKMYNPMKNASKDKSSAGSSLSGSLVDSISNFSVVKLFARGASEERHLAPSREKYVKTSLYNSFLQRIFWAIPGVLWDVLFGVTLALCAWLYTQGRMSIADVAVTTGVYFSVMGTISQLLDTLPNIIDKIGAASKAYDELVVPIEVTDVENAAPLVVTYGKIEFKNVWFRYGPGRRWILRDFNLTINPGESVGLVGASGAGKTTLVNLLMRFYDPTRGQILIDGQDIRTLKRDSLRRAYTMVLQDTWLFHGTIFENIAYGKPGATMDDVVKAAKAARIHSYISRLPEGYNTILSDNGTSISKGQKQLLTIARAMLLDAHMLILDEATSNVDTRTEQEIQAAMRELMKGKTCFVIAHRLSTIRSADHILVMRDGRVVEQGTHDSLMAQNGFYRQLYLAQFEAA